MVNIHDKAITHRVALAQGRIQMQAATLDLVESGTAQKGDVLGIARIAAIMAAKRTSDILPLCHPLTLTHITIDFEIIRETHAVLCTARVETDGKTGVEMEALTAVQIGLLTIYDMLKAVDRGMVMTDICLLEKAGGQSGTWKRR